MRILIGIIRLTYAFLAFMISACAATTPLGIHYGCDEHVATCDVRAADIDTLGAAAAHLVGVSEAQLRDAYLVVTFSPTRGISAMGEYYHGTCRDSLINVEYTQSVFDSHSALLHELVHAALYIKTGDYDAKHLRAEWPQVESVKAQLRSGL
jgi:hypothetical protein